MKDPIVEIKNVNFAYNGQTVLQDVNLDIHEGDFVAMIGPNGGGKTTLLKLILGLLKPDSGVIRAFNAASNVASYQIGYVPQNIHINRTFPITAQDVVLMGKLKPGNLWHRRTADERRDALDALDRLGMLSLAKNKIADLSGGQLQRVFIARALATDPRLLLLDEPTANVDTKGQTDLFDLLAHLNRDITILVVSHDLMVVSTYVKSVACVNKRLHYHNQAEITCDMLDEMYPSEFKDECPVELVAHGLPHRVLKEHIDNAND